MSPDPLLLGRVWEEDHLLIQSCYMYCNLIDSRYSFAVVCSHFLYIANHTRHPLCKIDLFCIYLCIITSTCHVTQVILHFKHRYIHHGYVHKICYWYSLQYKAQNICTKQCCSISVIHAISSLVQIVRCILNVAGSSTNQYICPQV